MLKLLAQKLPLSDIYAPAQPLGGSSATFAKFISPLIRDVLIFTAVASLLVLVVAGFSFVSSGGDKAKVQQASNMIVYAFIGLVLAVAAFALTEIFGRLMGFNLLNPGI